MKSADVPPVRRPPNPNQFELSIFGAGVGEALALHLGNNRWIVVDSLVDRITGNPVVLDYFAGLGIDFAEGVRCLVLTHWHNDHTRGAAEILETCQQAKAFASVALRTNEFWKFVAASDVDPENGADAFLGVLEALKRRNLVHRKEEVGFGWAAANKILFRSDTATVMALSPTDATVSLAFREIAQSITPNPRGRRAVAQEPNEVAVVLWIECGEVRVLLGADLEYGGSEHTGWRGILSSDVLPSGKASVFKIPHHGSAGADHPEVWTRLLENNPLCVLTPYSPGKKPLPTPEDVERIKRRTDRAFLTHPARGPRLSGVSATVEKIAKQVAPDIRDAEGPMSQVRIRIPIGGGSPTVETFGRASKL